MFRVVTVNGITISRYGGVLQDYLYSPGMIVSTLSSGSRKTIFNLFSQKTEKASLTINIIVSGRNREELLQRTDSIIGMFNGLCEIRMDGYLFRFALTQVTTEKKGLKSAIVNVTGTASKHLPMMKSASRNIYCRSTVPETDCILKATATAAAQDYILGSVKFDSVAAGDVLVVDGINCKITKNGTPCAAECDFKAFTILKPGHNIITCDDIPEVSYYPTF